MTDRREEPATPQLIEPLAIVVGNLVARYVEPPLRIHAVDDVLALLREVRRTPNPVEGEQPALLDVERLRDSAMDVEAGYINRPDRTSSAYWKKVAARYAYRSAQPSTEPAQGGEQ